MGTPGVEALAAGILAAGARAGPEEDCCSASEDLTAGGSRGRSFLFSSPDEEVQLPSRRAAFRARAALRG